MDPKVGTEEFVDRVMGIEEVELALKLLSAEMSMI